MIKAHLRFEFGPRFGSAQAYIVMAFRLTLLGCALSGIYAVGPVHADEPPGARSPVDELTTMHLADDSLTMELVASEPEVIDPVACAWDEQGHLYVAEMRDYPVGPAAGCIKQLVDRDGDGRYEQAHLFAEGLNFPNGVLPWRGGVLVTAAPEILFLKDENGDGRADRKQVLFTGFAEGNQQLRANGLLWGLDGWVYGANGRSDGAIRHPGESPDQAIPLGRHDFRFRPDTGQFEITTGFSQFGLARDDWGNRFLSWNIDPLRHVVIEQQYLARNPHLAASGVQQLIDVATSGEIYARAQPPQTFNRESVRHFNASCGVAIYRGDCMSREYYGNAFVCEPLTNLVHRRVLRTAGASFAAERGPKEAQQEFLASTDPWFHPVNLASGPDGALYVVDFYRRWVEHPQFVPEKLRAGVDFREGSARGRIWRIRPKADRCSPAAPQLASATMAQLVELFDRPNGWWRDTAQRIIAAAADDAAPAIIKNYLCKSRTDAGKAQALWTLHRLHALDGELLVAALSDGSPRVREQGLKLAEGRLTQSPKLLAAALALADDPDDRVRFQLALSLGNLPGDEKLPALLKLASAGSADHWLSLAMASGLHDYELIFLQRLFAANPELFESPKNFGLARELAQLIGARNQDDELARCGQLASELRPDGIGSVALLAGLAVGLQQHGKTLGDRLPSALGKQRELFDAVLARAVALASDEDRALDLRLMALDVLSQAGAASADQAILELLATSQPRDLQLRAARSIGERNASELAGQALADADKLSIPTRRELVSACCRSRTLARALLSAIEAGQLTAADVDFAQRDALLAVVDESERTRARTVLGAGHGSDRVEVLRNYEPALKLSGDPARGAIVFAQNCAICHLVQGFGARVGPELTGIGARAPAVLLTDILDPSKEVPTDFLNYLVATTDGLLLNGLIAGETASAITLRGPEAAETVILRERIERVQPTGKSLMPDGLEQKISIAQLADLLAFLARPDRKLIPANP